jgi:hypothetical protein
MSILGTTTTAGDDFEHQALAEIRDAGRGDWRAAAWLLQHHPRTREKYSDFDAHRTMGLELLDRVMKAWDLCNLSPEYKMRFLVGLQAVGLPTDKDYTDEAEQ